MVIDVYSVIFVKWGYEIMIIAIDNFILAVIVFTLEIIEFRLNMNSSRDN